MSDKAAAAAKAAAAMEAIQRWSMPAVDGPIVGRRMTEAEAKNAERVNYARGYELGIAAGKAECDKRIAELNARISRLDSILKMMTRPLEELDSEVEKQLTLLALTVGKQMVRRELKTDPAQVIAVIRESVGRLPVAMRDIRVHLHPDDAAVVREVLSTPTSDRAWNIVEDPALSRGGCMVRTDTSQIDARLDSRLNAVVSAAFGDERSSARNADVMQDGAQ